mmetsp:Transcript_21975/g.61460  ORF Transcript_21975/g.61460 Transcript_21975/m.61460 type:complete len:143 (+) Transcript_21975:1045-1473(+)
MSVATLSLLSSPLPFHSNAYEATVAQTNVPSTSAKEPPGAKQHLHSAAHNRSAATTRANAVFPSNRLCERSVSGGGPVGAATRPAELGMPGDAGWAAVDVADAIGVSRGFCGGPPGEQILAAALLKNAHIPAPAELVRKPRA